MLYIIHKKISRIHKKLDTNNSKKFNVVERLALKIKSNKDLKPTDSYVSKLINADDDLILKKIGEEAVEVILAAKSGSKKNLIHESADLFFHILVLFQDYDITLEDVCQELDKREGKSGIDEKNSRTQLKKQNV